MKKLVFYFSLISLLSCNHPERRHYAQFISSKSSLNTVNPSREHQTGYKVIGIKDGDTFVLLIDGKEQTVRLAHIDCPEKKQAFGSKAKQFASDLCFGKYVRLVHDGKYDRNKRLISEILLPDGRNINKEMVKNGLAWHFRKYSKSSEYSQLETKARNNRIGLWSESNPTAPWDWRKFKKLF